MLKNKENAPDRARTGLVSYFDQIIIYILFVIIIAVPLFFDVRLFSVFDLSKITVLYILTFVIVAICSIKTLIICRQGSKRTDSVQGEAKVGSKADGYGIWGYGYTNFLLEIPLNLPLIALVVASGLATIFSINPSISLLGTYKRYDGFLSLLVYVVIFYIVINLVERKSLGSFLNVIIWTACVASIYGVFQHFGIDLYQWQLGFSLSAGLGDRAASTFGHPAFFSAFLIMALPLVMVQIFSSKSSYKTSLYMAILVLLIVAFYYTKTRATFLGLIVSTTFFFSIVGRRFLLAKKTKTIVMLFLLIGISLLFNITDKGSPIGRFSRDIKLSKYHDTVKEDTGFTDHFDGTMARRVLQYLAGVNIIYDYPILGIGPETLGMIFPRYIAKVDGEENKYGHFENQDRIHNDFLDVMVSRGILGLGAYAWFIFAYSRMVWKGCKNSDNLDRVLIIGLCSGCLGYFIQNQFSFGHIPIITLFWFLAGMSVVACSGKKAANDDNPNLPYVSKEAGREKTNHTLVRIVKPITCIIIAGFMVILIISSLYRYKADIYFCRGQKLLFKNSTVEAVSNYEMAVRYNPEEISYRNALNGLYMKMASVLLDMRSENNDGGLPESSALEQATILLTNSIAGAKEVQRRYPNDYRSSFTLGQAYHILDRISEENWAEAAIKYYKHAAELQPFIIEIRDKLSQFYVENGHHELAVHELNEAIRFVPDDPLPYINLAKIFIDDERYSEAETVVFGFMRKSPGLRNIRIHQLLSDIYFKTEKWEELLVQSKMSIQLDKKSYAAYKYSILANHKLGKYKDARTLCYRILESESATDSKYRKFAKEVLKLMSEAEGIGVRP